MARRLILISCMTVTGLMGLFVVILSISADRALPGIIIGSALLWTTWYLWKRISPPSDSISQPTTDNPAPKPHLSFFGKLFAPPSSYPDKKAIKEVPCDIEGTGGFDFEVVGESHYRLRIWASIPDECSKMEEFRTYFIFKLQMEDDNEHDKNAVAVLIKGTVGYLPRDFAVRYRRWAAANGIGNTASCRGVVVGNQDKNYSIWLDLPDDLA